MSWCWMVAGPASRAEALGTTSFFTRRHTVRRTVERTRNNQPTRFIMSTMNAVIKTKPAPGAMEYTTTFPIPTITPDEVLIEIKLCGICGTDHSLYHWSEAIANSYKLTYPSIFGHEFSGVVAEIGSNVKKDLKVGDRVTANPILYCNECSYCAEGIVNVCDNRPFYGTDIPGAFAKYMAIRGSNVLKLTDNVSFKAGALLEPLCVAVHAVERVMPRFGDTCVVVGGGAIGLLVLKVLKWNGVGRVIVTGLDADKERLALAESFGGIPVNVEKQDPVEVVMKLTNGKGAEVLFDTAGHAAAVPQAMQMAAKRARIGVTGLPPKLTELSMTQLSMREISLVGNRAYELKNWIQAVKMVDCGLDIEPIGTDIMPLKDFEVAMKKLDCRQGLRILLEP